MPTTISAVDARRTLGELLNKVSLTNEEIIIERAGKKVAKLVQCDRPGEETSNAARGKLDFRKSGGLGQEVWKQINTDEYINKERDEWG
ncbi:MAG: type II toxin-antitoxin system Phd/YefM family antitoxin [Proteobacteria bacterium]|nr:type II toxin-antitoxin system Phd/YefM family antitoxin [Pseudomonadota bacterium]MBU1738190.1 type II toxin-antitoxin system Phd/YefM family antitoxin [Pseudomonadota bacterium]